MQLTFKGKELERALAKLELKSEAKIAGKAVAAGARLYRKELIANLPRDSEKRAGMVGGKPKKDVRLIRSIAVKKMGKTTYHVGVAGPARHYAHLIEYGFRDVPPKPIWRNTLDSASNRILKAMGIKAWQEILKHG